MKEITDIKPQVKDKNRCSVYLDGKFFCGLNLETAVKNKLKIGLTVSETELANIQLESEKSAAFDKAAAYLSKSAKTEKQIYDYLSKKGYTLPVAKYTVDKLKGYGFVNDAEYTESFVKSKGKVKGIYLLKAELKKRGAADTDIENALESLGDQTAAAAEIFRKYMKNKECSKQNLAKAYRHVLSKGFDYDTAKAAVKIFGEIDEDY